MRAVGVTLGGGRAGVRPGVKAPFRFKITFGSPGCPLGLPRHPQPSTLVCPSRTFAGGGGGG